MLLRDYQLSLIDRVRQSFQSGKRAPLLVAPTGSGKCLGINTPVLMYDGTVIAVQDVQVGDLLMGPDGMSRTVTSTTKGIGPLYKIVPIKGDPFVVNDEHILSLKPIQPTYVRYVIEPIFNISVKKYLSKGKNFKHVMKLWRTGISFSKIRNLHIPPYMLGLWLGDGHSRHFSITTGDIEIVDAVRQFANSIGLRIRCEPNTENSVVLHIVGDRRNKYGMKGGAPLRKFLRDTNLYLNKHIPMEYKTASRDDRLSLLAGILDTDGYLARGSFDLTLMNERLLDDVIFIARSLGFSAYKSEVQKKCYNNGKIGTYWRCSINGEIDQIPCRLKRKIAKPRRQIKNVLRSGFSVESIGRGDYYGFELSGPDRLFLLGDFTVTHNTVMFSAFTELSKIRGKRVLILAHRAELLKQIGETLLQFRITPCFIAPGYTFHRNAQVQVGSIFTVAKRLQYIIPPDLIIIDEAHHGTLKSTWGRVLNHFPNAYRIGVTATPARLSGEALGDLFDDLLIGPTVGDLISQGSLAPFRIWAPPTIDTQGVHMRAGDFARDELVALADRPSITGNAVDHYLKHAAGKRAIAFCVSREHATHVANEFARRNIVSVSVDGSMAKDIRERIIKNFKDGIIQVLTSCDLISEGFDAPGIECAILLRPTASMTLYLQQIGRALRVYPGKSHAIILDHAGNVIRHGLPDEPREWTLQGRTKHTGEYKVPIRACPQCFGINRGGVKQCEYCKYIFLIESRTIEQKQGDLQELDGQMLLKLKLKREQGMSKDYQSLLDLAIKRKYKNPNGWVQCILKARDKKKNDKIRLLGNH